MPASSSPFGTRATLKTRKRRYDYFSLNRLEKKGVGKISRMPFSLKVLTESVLRQIDGYAVREEDLATLCAWKTPQSKAKEFPFKPARVLMQDFTGVPAIVDLTVMRDAMADLGGDPRKINPVVPVELVIDHSVQVDSYATIRSLQVNAGLEFQRNRERYEFLRWGARSFSDFKVVPPATGIVHQVNLEYLARVVRTRALAAGEPEVAFPDTLVGTDSHTPMINGIGVLGWGVGGIEAEAALLGQPLYMLIPDVVGLKLSGHMKEGVTATDLVLTVTEMLRKFGVVDKIVEFFGPGLDSLSVADRATISNMSPEYGATAGFFPVDAKTLEYLELTGRDADQVDLIERYCKEQGLFASATSEDQADYTALLELDLAAVEACIAGPKRPQDRIPLSGSKAAWRSYAAGLSGDKAKSAAIAVSGRQETLRHGIVAIAAITSCTNTSNPSVMLAAGLLARNAVRLGLSVAGYTKTSLAPGSRVVMRYLDAAGLTPYLEALGFHVVGFGCTTCIGNSGPLLPVISKAIVENDLTVAAVLSGNRNFEGRIHPEVKASYLASPALVVAYALAGTMDIDFASDPIGVDRNQNPVYLRDIWPKAEDVEEVLKRSVGPQMFRSEYAKVYSGNETWNAIPISEEERYRWDAGSTYIRKPPFFEGLSLQPSEIKEIRNARVLALLGDSVTTDHISPAGSIPEKSTAGRWLMEHGVKPEDFNTYGSRRGNHEVMIRGTFANIRIKNNLVPGVEGGYTRHLPSGERMFISEAAERYQSEGVSLIVMAGKEYGSGSSRDWAAKGTVLLGVRAVIAQSYERIHRSNLIGMGVLPLQFEAGQSAAALGLSGEETYTIEPIQKPGQSLTIAARDAAGAEKRFTVRARIDTGVELEYYRNGGILATVLRGFARGGADGSAPRGQQGGSKAGAARKKPPARKKAALGRRGAGSRVAKSVGRRGAARGGARRGAGGAGRGGPR